MDDVAFRIFKLSASGYCCTQIIMKLILEDEEGENRDLIRAVNGLCRGIAGDQRICGVLTGAIGALGLYGGKGTEVEQVSAQFTPMMNAFEEWFEDEFESLECRDIIGVQQFEGINGDYQIKCGEIMMKSYFKVIELLEEYNFVYGERE